MWTITYDGVEQALETWGVVESSVVLTRTSQSADLLTFTVAAEITDADVFAHGEMIVMRRDRVWSGSAWTGGSFYFQGRCRPCTVDGSGVAEQHAYEFAGPWWDFERLAFQQSWNYYNSGTSSLTTTNTSEYFLGLDASGTPQTTGAQVSEAVAWAVTCGIPVQAGTIDTGLNIPSYNARDLTVAEVIRQMLRWAPDAVAWFDYTTSPPTFHVKRLAALTNVDLTLGVSELRGLRLRARNDLQLPAVVLKFKRVNEVNGTSWLDIFEQKYPVDATGEEMGASIHTIELGGFRANVSVGSIECETASPDSAAWWKKKLPYLESGFIDRLVISDHTVTDSNGDTVSLASYPRELVRGEITSWMDFDTVQVTVKAIATYDLYADTGKKIEYQKGKKEEVSTRITLTTATTGTYSNAESVDPAEAEPAGLAQGIYEARATLQHDGEIPLAGDEVISGVGLGNKVSIVGGRAAWANMLIQQVTETPGNGRLTIKVGAPNQLGVTDLIEMLRVNRYRIIYNSPLSRSTGKPTGGVGENVMGSDHPKENTTGGAGKVQKFSTVKESGTDYIVGELDSISGAFYLGTKDSTGAKVTTAAAVDVLLSSLGTKTAAFRWFYFKDAKASCAAKKMLVLCTEPEADT